MKHSIQRELILSELRSLSCHPSADELYCLLKNRMPHLSLATVYRNLEQFSRAGIIRKLDCGGELKRFDGNIAPHPHIRCPECGRISDVVSEKVNKLQSALLSLLPELDCQDLNIEFTAKCTKCDTLQEESAG